MPIKKTYPKAMKPRQRGEMQADYDKRKREASNMTIQVRPEGSPSSMNQPIETDPVKRQEQIAINVERSRIIAERKAADITAKALVLEKTPEQQATEAAVAETMATEQPQREEISPSLTTPLEGIPSALGGGIAAVGGSILTQWFEKNPDALPPLTYQGSDPETLRMVARDKIDQLSRRQHINANEQFGAMIEAIPIVGSLISKYAGGLLDTPADNVKEIVKNIKKETARASKYEGWAKNSIMDKNLALQNVREIEDSIDALESRIKTLINFSAELRYNSDGVNTIETDILKAREILFEAKLRIIQGLPAEPSDYAFTEALEDLS